MLKLHQGTKGIQNQITMNSCPKIFYLGIIQN